MNWVPNADAGRAAWPPAQGPLQHVAQQRLSRKRTYRLGDMGRALGTEEADGNCRARRVYDAVNVLGDATFCEYCAFGELRGGELVILVDCPEFVYYARTTWHARLMDHLRRCLPEMKIHRLTFSLVKREERDRQGLRFVPSGTIP